MYMYMHAAAEYIRNVHVRIGSEKVAGPDFRRALVYGRSIKEGPASEAA